MTNKKSNNFTIGGITFSIVSRRTITISVCQMSFSYHIFFVCILYIAEN